MCHVTREGGKGREEEEGHCMMGRGKEGWKKKGERERGEWSVHSRRGVGRGWEVEGMKEEWGEGIGSSSKVSKETDLLFHMTREGDLEGAGRGGWKWEVGGEGKGGREKEREADGYTLLGKMSREREEERRRAIGRGSVTRRIFPL